MRLNQILTDNNFANPHNASVYNYYTYNMECIHIE